MKFPVKLTIVLICLVFTSCNNLFLLYMDNTSAGVPQNKFIVIFHRNGGDTEAQPGRKVVTLPADTIGMLPFPPTKSGFTFTGWNTKSDGTGDVFTEATIVDESCTVFAQWH